MSFKDFILGLKLFDTLRAIGANFFENFGKIFSRRADKLLGRIEDKMMNGKFFTGKGMTFDN